MEFYACSLRLVAFVPSPNCSPGPFGVVGTPVLQGVSPLWVLTGVSPRFSSCLLQHVRGCLEGCFLILLRPRRGDVSLPFFLVGVLCLLLLVFLCAIPLWCRLVFHHLGASCYTLAWVWCLDVPPFGRAAVAPRLVGISCFDMMGCVGIPALSNGRAALLSLCLSICWRFSLLPSPRPLVNRGLVGGFGPVSALCASVVTTSGPYSYCVL